MKFECTQCGLCCTNLGRRDIVIALKADRQRIADRQDRDLAWIEQAYFERNAELSDIAGQDVYHIKDNDGRCVFLDDAGLCSIRKYKPYQCKHGPDRFFPSTMAKSYECMKGFENAPESDIEREFFDQLFSGD